MLFQGSKVDLVINVDRVKLIEKLKANRELHKQNYEAQNDAFKKKILEYARKVMDAAENGIAYRGSMPSEPTNYEPQYDRALGMLEISDQQTVALSSRDYARFWEDDWDWKNHFVNNSSELGAAYHE